MSDREAQGVALQADEEARQRGYCCEADARTGGRCEHLLALEREWELEDRQERARLLQEVGFHGLFAAARDGESWAAIAIDELLGPAVDDGGSGDLPPDPKAGYYEDDDEPGTVVHRTDPGAERRRDGDDEAADGDNASVGHKDGSPDGPAEDVDAGALVDEENTSEAVGRRRRLDRPIGEVLKQIYAEASAALGVDLETFAQMTGPALAAVLAGLDVDGLPPFAKVEVVAAYKRLEAWAAGGAAISAASLSTEPAMLGTTGPAGAPGAKTIDGTGEELALRLGVTRQEAAKMVAVGQGLAGAFKATTAHLREGVIDYRKASTIVTRLHHSSTPVAWLVEQEVLTKAGGLTAPQLERAVEEELVRADPLDAQVRHDRAKRTRKVTHTQVLPDGMGRLSMVLTAPACAQVDLVLDTMAHAAKAGGDGRGIDALRADVAVALITGRFRPGHSQHGTDVTGAGGCGCGAATSCGSHVVTQGADGTPAHLLSPKPPPPDDGSRTDVTCTCGLADLPLLPPLALLIPEDGEWFGDPPPVSVRITVPLSVALPEAENGDSSAEADEGSPPVTTASGDASTAPEPHVALEPPERGESAVLEGYGPIPPEVARALAAGGTWKRLVTDPRSGALIDVGRTRYRPPADLVEHVRLRDRTCVRGGCRAPASRCQYDHTLAWSQGGHTAHWNGGPLCHRDHNIKTSGLFALAQPDPGVFEWLTPTGHAYRREVDGTTTMLPQIPPSLAEQVPAPY